MNIERYLGVYYPFFHRRSVTGGRLLTLLAILCILPIIVIMISVNDLVISLPVAIVIFLAIVFPPIIFLNYKLFRISRKGRPDNTASPEVSTLHVNLKKIHIQRRFNSTLNCVIFFWKNAVLRREGIKVLKSLKNRLFPC
jgi:hypothetical protein